MAGAHLAPSIVWSRWCSLLCSCLSTSSAKALSASFLVRICLQKDSCLGYVTSHEVYIKIAAIVNQVVGTKDGEGRR
jgi:hypothetical protein